MRIAAALLVGTAMVVVGSPAQAAPPTVGTCLTYSSDQWVQSTFTAGTFDCATSHNGEVLGTVAIPAEIEATGYSSSAMLAWAFRACQTTAVDYTWTASKAKYTKSSYVMPRSARLNIQVPTPQAWAAGDRWAACLGQSRNTALSKPQARTGSVRGTGLKPYVCMNPRNWNGMKCSKPDAIRLTNQVWLATSYGQAYPGSDKLLRVTQKSCQRLRKNRDTLRTWFVPGFAAWERGNRYGFCQFVK